MASKLEVALALRPRQPICPGCLFSRITEPGSFSPESSQGGPQPSSTPSYLGARCFLVCSAATHVPCLQFPLWQSRLPLHTPASVHLLAQSPPQRLLMSLGVQHLPLAHAKLLQSSLVVQPCPSRQWFAQLPLHAGPQQRPPEHAPLWQSRWPRQMPASGHLAPQVPPHWLVASLGRQHCAFTQAKCWQSAPLVHPWPSRQLFEQLPLHAGPQQR
jgi:hypothetical protein